MTTPPNGQVPNNYLTDVQGMPLELNTASAFQLLNAQHGPITIAGPAGGYRDLATQQAMIANPSAYNVRPGITLESVGHSTHGWGYAVDMTGPNLTPAIAAMYGFVRTMPITDPNHYEYDGPYSWEQGGTKQIANPSGAIADTSTTYGNNPLWSGPLGITLTRRVAFDTLNIGIGLALVIIGIGMMVTGEFTANLPKLIKAAFVAVPK